MWQPPTVWLYDTIFHQQLFHFIGLLLNTRRLGSQVKLFNNSSSLFVPCSLVIEPRELVLSSKNKNYSFFLCVSWIINTKYHFHLLSILEQQENFWSRGWSHRSTEKMEFKECWKILAEAHFCYSSFQLVVPQRHSSAWWCPWYYIVPLLGLSSPSNRQFAFLLNNSQKLVSILMISLVWGCRLDILVCPKHQLTCLEWLLYFFRNPKLQARKQAQVIFLQDYFVSIFLISWIPAQTRCSADGTGSLAILNSLTMNNQGGPHS